MAFLSNLTSRTRQLIQGRLEQINMEIMNASLGGCSRQRRELRAQRLRLQRALETGNRRGVTTICMG